MARTALVLGLVGAVACGGVAKEPARPRVTGPVVNVAPVVVPVASTVPVPVPAPTAIAEAPLEVPDPEEDFRQKPKEVEAELKSFSEAYTPMPRLRRLPDYLSVDQVVAMLPEEGDRTYLREEIHQQLEGGLNDALLGSFLDETDQRLFALWARGNLVQVLAVYESGKLLSKRVISRGKAPLLADLLPERDGARLEILIERVTTMSVCCLPLSLEVYRIGKRGAVTQVLDFPRGHVEVGPGERWSFLNHFEFDGDRVVVSSAFPGDQPSYELRFDTASGKYLPTPATAKQLADERRERAKLKASGQLLEE